MSTWIQFDALKVKTSSCNKDFIILIMCLYLLIKMKPTELAGVQIKVEINSTIHSSV